MLFKKREPTLVAPDIAVRVSTLEQDVIALRRGFTLLDAQFDELVDKAYRKWARARMEVVRDEEHAEKVKQRPKPYNLNQLMQNAIQKATEK